MNPDQPNQGPSEIPAEKNVRQNVRQCNTATVSSSEATTGFRQHKLPNDGAHPGTTSPDTSLHRQRRAVHDLDAIRRQLTDRDYIVLNLVWAHRVLTTRQVHALVFGHLPERSGLRLAQQTLTKLRKLWVLGVSSQQRHRLRRGRPESIYYVDMVGDRLLRADRTHEFRYQWKEPTLHYLSHQLAIADVHTELVTAQHRGQLELLTYDPEPDCWRSYSRWGSPRTLKSDMFIQTASTPESPYVDGFFVEVDLGTESIPTVLRKCHEYQAYWTTGAEQDDDGNGFPLVVWRVAHHDPKAALRRRALLGDEMARDRELDPDLFRIVAPDQLIHLITKGDDI